jgi:predicted heme/steroid binding protein
MSAPRTFSKAEVAKHNKKGDLWVVVRGQVVDVSKFAVDHPGGEEYLLENAGKGETDARGRRRRRPDVDAQTLPRTLTTWGIRKTRRIC